MADAAGSETTGAVQLAAEKSVQCRYLVALGSSFAAGPGIEPVVDAAAKRSGRNYPHLLADLLGATLTDLTVSGASVATILDRPQRTGLTHRFAPQLDRLPTDADLVTITVGGNDLGYSTGMISAAFAGWLGSRATTRWLGRLLARRVPTSTDDRDVERLTTGLARVVQAVQTRAPLARVVLVEYLTVFGGTTISGPAAPLPAAQLARFRDLARQLNAAYALAADRTGAELLRASTLSADHGLGSEEPWVTGFRPTMRPVPFHPTADGMLALALAIRDHLATVEVG
jgi:lysophospholipase L1-like esterase